LLTGYFLRRPASETSSDPVNWTTNHEVRVEREEKGDQQSLERVDPFKDDQLKDRVENDRENEIFCD